MQPRPRPHGQRLKLRKYPNRRYYDSTRSCHVSLEEIYNLVRDGHELEITDSKTGGDITGKVLVQTIIDHEPEKLDVFPVELLHRIIFANEELVLDFVEKYFNRALMAFTESQQHFDQYLRQSFDLPAAMTMGAEWTRTMLHSFEGAATSPSASGHSPGPSPSPASAPPNPSTTSSGQEMDGLRRELDELRRRVAALDRRHPGQSGG